MEKILVECASCGGTGLYSGFMEREGEAVICASCGGTGARELSGKPFTCRKRRLDITKIRAGSGTILDNPSKASWMSYEEFERRVPSKQ